MATEEDKSDTGALLTVVAVGTFVMIGISLAVTAITREELGRATAEKEASGSHAYQAMHGEQLAKLATGKPVEQAMQQVVSGLQRDPNSATPPAAATAAPTPAPSGSAAEAAPAPAPSAATPGGAKDQPAPPPSSAPAKSVTPAKEKPVAPAAEPGKPKPPAAPATPPPAPPSSAHG